MNLNSRWLPDTDGTITLSLPYDPSFLTVQAVNGSGIPFVKLNSSYPLTITLPQAVGLFGQGWASDLHNAGLGIVTLAATTSTIESFTSITLSRYQTVRIVSDGVNFETFAFLTFPPTPLLDASGNPICDDAGNWIYE